ncbi:MAG: hypothetical protein SW833_13010 [Cyanobacteriota bacterium]|nr:hypothetical protein [Cyanobacteriota bacterium]
MSTLLTPKNAIAPTPAKPLPQPQSQPQKERLVARWLRDENNQLYCQWVTQKS